MNQIDRITNESIKAHRQAITALDEELASINPEIAQLKQTLEGNGEETDGRDYREIRQALDTKQAQAFTLRKKIAEAREALKTGAGKWANDVINKNRKLTLAERVKMFELLDQASRSVIGEKDYSGPSLLTIHRRLEENHNRSSTLMQELELAYEVVGQRLVGGSVRSCPAIPPWKEFSEKLLKQPAPSIAIENGQANPRFWIAGIGGERPSWIADLVSQEELKRRRAEAAELKYRLDPGLRAREEANLRYAAERDRKQAEWNAMSLEERAARGLLTGGDIWRLSILSKITHH
jgi:hypothetical protein